MTGFGPGDVVTITIKGARVVGCAAGSELTVTSDADVNSHETTFDLTSDQVTVERAAPAKWPPRTGDLWRDCNGSVWFALQPNKDTRLIPGDPTRGLASFDPTKVLAMVGPLALVHREEAGS